MSIQVISNAPYNLEHVLCVLCISQFQLCTTTPLPSRADPRALAFFLPWMANSRQWGQLSCQIPQSRDENRGQMPRPPSTLKHFSLIAQLNSAILSTLMRNFFVSIYVFLCHSVRILIRLYAATTPVYCVSTVIKLLTLKLIEHY